MENASPAESFYERKADAIFWTFGGLGLFFIVFGGSFLAFLHDSVFLLLTLALGVPMLLVAIAFGFLVLDITSGTITFGYALRPHSFSCASLVSCRRFEARDLYKRDSTLVRWHERTRVFGRSRFFKSGVEMRFEGVGGSYVYPTREPEKIIGILQGNAVRAPAIESAPLSEATVPCPNCGAENPASADRCPTCFHRFNWGVPGPGREYATTPVLEDSVSEIPPVIEVPSDLTPSKQPSKRAAIVAVLVILVMFAGVMAPILLMATHNIQRGNEIIQESQQAMADYVAVPGTYSVDGYVYIVLNKDGTFAEYDHGKVGDGHYYVNGTDLVLKFGDASGNTVREEHCVLSDREIQRRSPSPDELDRFYSKVY